MNNYPNLSVIIPAYNEARGIGDLVKRVKAQYVDSEVIVVNDGSSDKTEDIARASGAVVLTHPYRKGNGAAIKTGIRHANGEVFVFMDGDGQHDPGEIAKLIQHYPLYDMVVGKREVFENYSWARKAANKVFNMVSSYFSGFKILDLTSGFRMIKKEIAKNFAYLLPNAFSYPTTITLALVKAGYSIRYEDITSKERKSASKIKPIRDGVRFLLIILKIISLFNPFKVFFPLSMIMFVPGFFYAIYKIVIGSKITLPTVLLLTVGSIIFVLGLIAEQIAMLRFEKTE